MARDGKQTNLKKVQSKKGSHLKEDAKKISGAAQRVFSPLSKQKGR